MKVLQPYQKEFRDRTRKHIDLVNKYAMKIGKHFPMHDCDKLDELFEDYSLMKKKTTFGGTNLGDNPDGLTAEEQERLNKATATHITTNQHHAEYWAKEKDEIKSFDRFNPPKGLHCEDMTEEALDEMCADWSAMSEEFGNTPQEWMAKTVPTRWIFTDEQVEYIKNRLDEMWGGND